jgi:signal transduction histidine kinase
MLGLVTLAKAEKNTEMTSTYLEMIKDSLRTQERYIKEMIALSKENKKVLKKEIVDLGYLINQVINLHKHMTGADDIEFSKTIGVHRVFSDAHRLEVILNNLVSNAIKYHDHTKTNKYIKINTYSNQDSIFIEVLDNGIGIDGKDKSKIFEMYYMSNDREKGTGLGLYIVKEAMTKIGGEIKVESEKGEGSAFTLILKK